MDEFKLPIKDPVGLVVGKLCVDLIVVPQVYEFSEFSIPDNRSESNFNVGQLQIYPNQFDVGNLNINADNYVSDAQKEEIERLRKEKETLIQQNILNA